MRGQRGAAELTVDGAVVWADLNPSNGAVLSSSSGSALSQSNGPVQLGLHVNAKNLQADSPLYSLLPCEARAAWGDVQPHGALDADLTFRQSFARDETPAASKAQAVGVTNEPIAGEKSAAAVASVASALGAAPGGASAVIFAAADPLPESLARMPFGLHAVLLPRGMSCTLACLPYQFDNVRGTIRISPDKVILENMEATHGRAALIASGFGSTGPHPAWNLKLNMRDVPVDDELRRALPAALVSVLDSIKLRGNIDVDIPKFISRSGAIALDSASAPASAPAATAPASPVDIDMTDTVITFNNCLLEAGVPHPRDMNGKMKLKMLAVHGGKISAMDGSMSLPKVNISGRNLTDVNLKIRKLLDRQEISLEDASGTLAGGQAAGEVHLSYPDDGPARYMLSAVVRNARPGNPRARFRTRACAAN